MAVTLAHGYARDGGGGAVETGVTAGVPVTVKFSAAKTALILLFLLAVWVAFIVLPSRKGKFHKTPALGYSTETKLRAAGLSDNPDFDGLPEIFAIWADKADWKDGKTRFAYWHPVMKTYGYYFEASRDDTGVHFREIPEPHDPTYRWDDSLSDDCPIRFYIFVPPAMAHYGYQFRPMPEFKDEHQSKPQVSVTPPRISSPSFEPIPINAQPKR